MREKQDDLIRERATSKVREETVFEIHNCIEILYSIVRRERERERERERLIIHLFEVKV